MINGGGPLKRPIRLLFAISLYEINGACIVAKNLIEGLDRERFEITLMAEQVAERHLDLGSNIKVINLDLRPKKGLIKKILNIRSHLRKIRKAALEQRPDIILSFGTILNCYLLFALRLAGKRGVKIVISEHSEGFFTGYSRPYFKDRFLRRIYRLMMRFSYRKADCIIAVSQSIAENLKRLLKDSEKIKVIYNPVNINGIRKLLEEEDGVINGFEDLPRIVTVSRLSREKGMERLIMSFAGMVRRLDSRLIIVGDGRERLKLEALAETYNIGDKVRFMGWQDNPFKYLKRAGVFALPSIYEGFPNAVLEAMACGVPVVASRSAGGIEELIDQGVDGILVNAADPAAFSNALYELLSDQASRNRIIAAASKKVERFDILKVAKEYEAVLDGLI
ncbi:glycosyltransferase [Candidatus Omnitrophota bacterium]